MIVVDASVALKWVLDESGRAAALTVADGEMAAPDLLLLEASNTLWWRVRRKLITQENADSAFRVIEMAPISYTPVPELLHDVRRLAALLDITTYDACYAALAQRLGAGLATADKKLANAAEASGIVSRVVFIS